MAQCHKRAFVTPPQSGRLIHRCIHTDRSGAGQQLGPKIALVRYRRQGRPAASQRQMSAILRIQGRHYRLRLQGRPAGCTSTSKLQLSMVLAFGEWWQNSIRDRSVAGQVKAWTKGRFPGRRPSLTEQQRGYIRVERSKGVSQGNWPSSWRSAAGPSNRWTGRR